MQDFHNIGDDWSDLNCDKLINKMKDEAEARPDYTITGACGAWSVCFSIDAVVGKIFSARVRVSHTKNRDWHILGRMAKLIGAPDREIGDTIVNAPDSVHYWVWDGQAPLEEVKRVLGLVRGSVVVR